jgi:hypothetical protein
VSNHSKAAEQVVFLGPGRYLEAFGTTIAVGDPAPYSEEEIAALEAQGLRFGAADAAEPAADIGEGQPNPNDHEEE